MIKRTIPPLLKPFLPTVFHHLRPLTAAPATDSSPSQLVNPAQLLRVCTILYQQQNSSDSKLFSSLNSFPFHLTHEFFLQVCNKFPYSWKPVYKFFQYTQSHPGFRHTSTSFNKLADVASKSRNISFFWDILDLMAREKLANDKTFRIALKTLASARELKKCVEFFHLMNENGVGYNVETLNKVVETLCGSKLVEEAKHVVLKMKGFVEPNRITYECLVKGFCEAGDLIEACKLWNLMVDEGLEPDMSCVETIMETFFKINRYGEGLKLLENVRSKRIEDLGLSTYRLVIDWLCKKGRIGEANMIFEEMRNRGIEPDNLTLSSLVYGLVMRGRVREGYKIVEGVERPDISVYHGLIKGLLKLKRAGEATEVFREMIRRGCEPTMHTYVMLLQGHLGRRGRKGHDPLVNFDTIFVGGLVKAGKSLEATKYVERAINRGLEVPRFDYNKFLHYFSNEEGVVMFEETGKKLREVGLFDLADIFIRYGEKMATRDRRRDRERFCHEMPSQVEQNLELPSEVFDADIVNVKKLS